MVRPHRRHPVRGRRRAPGPSWPRERKRRPASRQHPRQAPLPPRRRRGVSRTLLGLGLRRGDERQAVEHHRLREALEFPALQIPGRLRERAGERAGQACRDGRHPAVEPGPPGSETMSIRLGLRENLAQFSLLVVVNAFVGAVIGMERSILPAIGEQDFQLAARTAVLSFIVVFGITKALTNYLAGRLSDRFGRKHVLVGGWVVAAPVPFLLMWAPSWNWVLFANILLGVRDRKSNV